MNLRRTQLILAAFALAAPALLAACGAESSEAAAGEPTSSAAAPASTPASSPAQPGVTQASLLTDADTVYSDGADWFRVATGDEDLDGNGDLAHPCLAGGLAATGATEVVRADFELRNAGAGAPEVRGDLLTQLVAEYDDAAAATKAWSTVNGLLGECVGRPAAISDYRSLQTRKVKVAAGDAVITDSHYGPVPKELDPTGESAYIMETGAAVRGATLVVLTSVVVAQDYNFLPEDGGTPVERMLPVAVDRLG